MSMVLESMLENTVLVLDDDLDIGEVIADAVEAAGYNSLIETDPWRALKVLKNKPIGLVISDYRMPGLSGWEFYQILRTLNSAPKIAYVTGFSHDLPSEIKDDPDVMVVKKPFSVNDINKILKTYLEQKRSA